MPDEAGAVATIEAPETAGGDIGSTDVSTADSGTIETSTDTNAQIDQGDSPQEGETGHLRGAELYRACKEKLKQSGLTAQEQRSIRNAIHIAAKAEEATGGDLGRFESERQAYSQLAMEGEEGYAPEQVIEKALLDRQQLKGILEDIESGGKVMLEDMISDHPETLQALLPQAMDWLSTTNNEAFSSYIANTTLRYLDSAKIPLQFAILDTFLPKQTSDPGTLRVIQAVEAIRQAFSGIESLAAKPYQAQKPQTQAQNGNNRQQTIEQREFRVTMSEWNQSAGQPNITLRDSEMNRVASARKLQLTEPERTKIKAAVKDEFNARLAANRNYGETMQSYIRSGNRKGYFDRAASEGKKLLPDIVKRHTNAILDERSAAAKPNGKVAGTSNGNNGAVPRTTGEKDASGNLIQWLSGHPKTVGKHVDLIRTPHWMLAKNQAYIVGEKNLFKWPAKKS